MVTPPVSAVALAVLVVADSDAIGAVSMGAGVGVIIVIVAELLEFINSGSTLSRVFKLSITLVLKFGLIGSICITSWLVIVEVTAL